MASVLRRTGSPASASVGALEQPGEQRHPSAGKLRRLHNSSATVPNAPAHRAVHVAVRGRRDRMAEHRVSTLCRREGDAQAGQTELGTDAVGRDAPTEGLASDLLKFPATSAIQAPVVSIFETRTATYVSKLP
jgi:hypothetical protein